MKNIIFVLFLSLAFSGLKAQAKAMSVSKYDVKTHATCADVIPVPVFKSTCKGDLKVTSTDRVFSGGCAGTIERTYMATDECENSMQAIKYIHLEDTNAPRITKGLEDIEVKDLSTVRLARPQAEDDCAGKLIWTNEDSPLPGGMDKGVTRTFTVIDACGNSSSTSVKITILK
jgi:hypothetical protein